MWLTVVGCRSGMPSEGQSSSSYLVGSDSARVLLDCGPGTATTLGVHPTTLDGIVISHLHLDHCYDLLPVGKMLLASHARHAMLFPTLRSAPSHEPRPPVPLYVPEGGRAVLEALAALFPVGAALPILDKAFSVAFDVREYQPGDTFSIGDLQIEVHGLRHIVPNCGIRVESATGSLAYTGDTGTTDELVGLARGVDLLLAEATLELPDSSGHGHLCALEAAEAAARARVGQLVLTHFITDDDEWLEARRAEAVTRFGGPVHVARPGRHFAVRAA
jgi:ribonuclease BN (tRNA processing enzyme)